MVRAGTTPLDRAHAHARWAERYDAQGDAERAAAHFGRAMHYAQMVQAFGAGPEPEPSSKRAREEGMGDIVVGRWEAGKEVWTALYSERTKRKRMQQVFHGHGATKADPKGHKGTAEPMGSLYRVLPGLLDALYASESSGDRDSVHCDKAEYWYIHRDSGTSLVYLVPAPLAGNKDGARDLVFTIGCNLAEPSYTYGLSEGLLIVQDKRPGRVQVKRGGLWGPATRLETFAYYDFLLRYPSTPHYYLEQRAPAHTATSEQFEQNGHVYLTLTRNDVGIFVSLVGDDLVRITPHQISDVAWRAASVSTFEGNALSDDTRPSGIVHSEPEERGFLYG
jgi:hypothetical protein